MSDELTRHGIGELARLGGVTPRTIRYYVAQGLLPAPEGAGPGAHYGSAHLERLQLIRRLQRQHLPLAEIRSRLHTLRDEQVSELNRAVVTQPPPAGSALDYIRAVLGPAEAGAFEPPLAVTRPLPPASLKPGVPPRRPAGGRLLAQPAQPSSAQPSSAQAALGEAAPTSTVAPASTTEHTLERSQWERLSLGPNLELHVRRPLGRLEQRRVERLITIARQVLKEEMP